MKLLLLSLCSALFLYTAAQTEFKLNAGTPLREYHEVAAVNKDGYILKFTNAEPTKQGVGKFVKYSTENKLVVQKPYKVELGFKTIPFSEIMFLKNNKAWLTLGGSPVGGDISWKPGCVMRWQSPVKDYSIQPFDLTTMQATGTPVVIGIPTKKDLGNNSLIYSPAGNRLAIIASEYNVYGTFKYKLMDATGKELFTKEYTVPAIKNWRSVNKSSVQMNENGELAFMVADFKDDKEPGVTLVHIGADQKLSMKKIEVKGKYISKYIQPELQDDASIKIEMYTYSDTKLTKPAGKVIQTYSPNLELTGQTEDVCVECKLPNAKEIVKLDGGGYLVIDKQEGQRQTGPQKWDNTYVSFKVTGYNDNFEELYSYDVHTVDKSSTWSIYRPFKEYIDGDKIYVFHGGNDDKVKNTKEEFELYCTYWQHGKTKPQTVKVQLPFPDLNLEMAWYREMDNGKLLLYGEGNGGKVYTTLNIINR